MKLTTKLRVSLVFLVTLISRSAFAADSWSMEVLFYTGCGSLTHIATTTAACSFGADDVEARWKEEIKTNCETGEERVKYYEKWHGIGWVQINPSQFGTCSVSIEKSYRQTCVQTSSLVGSWIQNCDGSIQTSGQVGCGIETVEIDCYTGGRTQLPFTCSC